MLECLEKNECGNELLDKRIKTKQLPVCFFPFTWASDNKMARETLGYARAVPRDVMLNKWWLGDAVTTYRDTWQTANMPTSQELSALRLVANRTIGSDHLFNKRLCTTDSCRYIKVDGTANQANGSLFP